MKEIDARVTGFDYSTFHAYTTEVDVDGRSWTLAIRYNTFYQFYTRLSALEKHFTVDFPPKGGLFFSPPPEERQEQLDDFLLSTLAYFDMRGHPRRMEALLGELLQIPQHLGVKEDDEEGHTTASEGSSVAEELLLDTPVPGHDESHDDFLTESGHEETYDDEDDGQEDQQYVEDNQVEVVLEVDDHRDNDADASVNHDEEEEVVVAPAQLESELEGKPEVAEEQSEVVSSSPETEDKATSVQQQPRQLTGGAVAKNYIAMLRRRTLVNGAIQAAVVSTMKQNVEKSKAAKAVKTEEATEELNPVQEDKEVKLPEAAGVEAREPEALVAVVVEEEKAAAPEEPTVQTECVIETPMSVVDTEDISTTTENEAVKKLEPEVASVESSIEADFEETQATESEQQDTVVAKDTASSSASETRETELDSADSVQEDESSSEEESEETAPEPTTNKAEAENPVVSWFRRMGTFGLSSTEKEEQEAVAKKEQEEKEAAAQEEAQAKAKAKVKADAEAAEAEANAEAEAVETELLRAEQELNLRLRPYRHPVFFQGFNCDVGTSRYSLPPQLSEGIVV